jgi:hypothetical protein
VIVQRFELSWLISAGHTPSETWTL